MSISLSKLLWFLHVLLLIILPHSLANSQSPNDIFILAGQSNMAGRGGVDNGKWNGYIPPQCKSNPSILRLSGELKWEEASEPLQADIDLNKTCGIGPGMAFANGIKANDSRIRVVGLVPYAIGGTKISEWARGTRLYQELVRRAAVSVSSSGGTIRALLWYQGESDTVLEADAVAYKQKMETLIVSLRSDLNIPSLPVIQVALASGEGKYVEIVRRGQQAITLPNVKCIDAKGLHLKTDNLHLTTTSEVGLGLKFANAYISSFAHFR